MAEQEVGKVAHFFGKISVGMVRLSGPLKVGDSIKVKTGSGEFTQTVESMQVDRVSVTEAAVGAEVGMKVAQPVKEGDTVFLVS